MYKKVVVLGGGTGISYLLKGLKDFPVDITAVITVSDNGRSTGKLREEFHTPAVGDIRKVITKDLIEDKEQRQLVEQKLGSLINKKNAITGREIFEASKSALRDIRLIDETQEAIRKSMNDEKNIEEK